jgi:hypothetical protein
MGQLMWFEIFIGLVTAVMAKLLVPKCHAAVLQKRWWALAPVLLLTSAGVLAALVSLCLWIALTFLWFLGRLP